MAPAEATTGWVEYSGESFSGPYFGMVIVDAHGDALVGVGCHGGYVYANLFGPTSTYLDIVVVAYRFTSQTEPTVLTRSREDGIYDIRVYDQQIQLADAAPFVAELAKYDGDELFVLVQQGWDVDSLENVYSATFDTSGAQKAVESVTGNCGTAGG